jgi:hypothetical protein
VQPHRKTTGLFVHFYFLFMGFVSGCNEASHVLERCLARVTTQTQQSALEALFQHVLVPICFHHPAQGVGSAGSDIPRPQSL